MSSSETEPSQPREPAALAAPSPATDPAPAAANRTSHFSRRGKTVAVAAGFLMVGVILGAGALRMAGGRPGQAFVLQPSPITSMSDLSPVAIKGQVAEVFGNKFIIADPTGRALVETGPEGGRLVQPNEAITVQGRFEHGFIRAAIIQHEDGHADLLGPPNGPPPPHGTLAWLRDVVRR